FPARLLRSGGHTFWHFTALQQLGRFRDRPNWYLANSASNLSSIQFGKQKDSGGLPCNLKQREARNLFFPSPAAAHWSNCRELPIRRLDTPQRPYGPQRAGDYAL